MVSAVFSAMATSLVAATVGLSGRRWARACRRLGALRLGAATAVRVDIDASAIRAARRNARLNGLATRMEATFGPLGEVEGVFDVVLANIGRAALVELVPELRARLAPDGWLAVSGISPPRCSLAAALLAPLEVLELRMTPDWSAVVLVHFVRTPGLRSALMAPVRVRHEHLERRRRRRHRSPPSTSSLRGGR
jgi:hypothetical protein